MNKFMRFALIVFVLLLAVPVLAQDVPRPSVNISIDDIFWVVIGLAGILYGIIKSLRAGTSGQQVDAETQARLLREQHDRDMMDRYERIHQNASQQGKEAFGALVGIVQSFAGLTSWKGDDAFAGFLKDIQQPGAPAAALPVPVPAPVIPAPGEVIADPKNR